MPQLIEFNHKALRQGDLVAKKQVNSYVSDVFKGLNNSQKGNAVDFNPLAVADAICNDKNSLAKFERAFNRELGLIGNQTVKFNLLTDEEIQAQEEIRKNYDVTVAGGTLAPTIGTDIAPTIEALIRDTGILSRITQVEASRPNESRQLWDFDAEGNAANLTEVAAGSDVDDIPRNGDLLLTSTKVQASTKFSELALSTMDATEYGIFMGRIVRRVQYILVNNILNNGSTASNNTARPNAGSIRGINNNWGVDGTGDATNFIGAITFATKAAADAVLPVASTDSYDLCVKMKRANLPNNLSEVEEEDYVFIMNRTTWGAISTVPDLNGRYKAQSSIDPATGKAVKQIDGTEVMLSLAVANNRVFLVPLKLYELLTYGGFQLLNDGGLVQLREGLISYVARIWATGSMRYGHKYLRGTAATIGTTAIDNQQQNAHRYFAIT